MDHLEPPPPVDVEPPAFTAVPNPSPATPLLSVEQMRSRPIPSDLVRTRLEALVRTRFEAGGASTPSDAAPSDEHDSHRHLSLQHKTAKSVAAARNSNHANPPSTDGLQHRATLCCLSNEHLEEDDEDDMQAVYHLVEEAWMDALTQTIVFEELEIYIKWRSVSSRPDTGRELVNQKLTDALATRVTFTREEWATFGITDLRAKDFIRSGIFYYQVVGVADASSPRRRRLDGSPRGRRGRRTPFSI
eukprot:236314-Prymnesium_polylepis.1